MTFNLNLPDSRRLKQGFRSVCESGLCCWRGSARGGGPSAPRGPLRRFLLLKLVTVLLFPHGAWLPLLVGCVFSVQALLLLRSPRISTKPSTVLLGQLALTDTLLLLHWGLGLGATLGLWVEGGPVDEVWWWEAVRVLCKGLQDAHRLASLLLLGLVGLEATLVSRWPLQTRRLRTAHSAQFSCTLAWVLVILELLVLQASKLGRDSGSLTDPLALSVPLTASHGLAFSLSLPPSSVCLRKVLWLANSWLHYGVLYNKPQRTNNCFH